MRGKIEIVAPGAYSAVQDMGRPGQRHLGIPIGIAADPFRLQLINRLVGNSDQSAAIEFRIAGPTVRAKDGPVCIAVAGAANARVARVSGGTHVALPQLRTVTLKPGDTLTLGALSTGATGYLAIAGGIDVPEVLGGRATCLRAGFGGHKGRLLRAGDVLAALPDTGFVGDRKLAWEPEIEKEPLRIMLGPQDDHFSDVEIERFINQIYTVTPQADRMGVRLEGPAIRHLPSKGAGIISDGLVPGVIQVPGDGQPIILFADCHTVGGYPKIATIITADLGRVGQLRPGDAVGFEAVTLDAAIAIDAERKQMLKRLTARFEPCGRFDGVDPDALYNENIISGTVDAFEPAYFPGNLETK